IAGETLSAPSTGRVSREFPGREISIVAGQANAWQKDASMCCFVLFQWPVNRRSGVVMEIKQVYVDGFSVSGLRVRTRNIAEQDAATAKIGPMWGQFYSEGLTGRIAAQQPESPIYGVYSSYESDATGEFDVTAGVAVLEPAADLQTI